MILFIRVNSFSNNYIYFASRSFKNVFSVLVSYTISLFLFLKQTATTLKTEINFLCM